MANYELNSTVPSPGDYISFIEFSPNGRFLGVGDCDHSSVCILDRRSGFHRTILAVTPAEPTALVWESSEAFYVGLRNGIFIRYRIKIGGGAETLERGLVNNLFHGTLPVTAMGLDEDSKTLVLSVGPGIFALRRVNATNDFRSIGYISSRINLPNDPGSPAPPFPRSVCFSSKNTLVITFCRQHIASVTLEFDGDSHLNSSFQTARIDYTGLPVLKAIASGEGDIHRLTRCWIYGHDDSFPFLFINEGAATVSGTALGAAVIRDAVTQREVQMLKHTGAFGQYVSIIAYHVSKEGYSIATADRGENAKIKVWTARRSSIPKGHTRRRSLLRKGFVIVALLVSSTVIAQGQMGRIPGVIETLCFFSRIVLTLVHLFIYFAHAILGAMKAFVEELRTELV